MQDGTGFPRLRVFIISFANLKDSIKMTDVRVRVTLMDSKGEIMEREVCVPPTKMCAKTHHFFNSTPESGLIFIQPVVYEYPIIFIHSSNKNVCENRVHLGNKTSLYLHFDFGRQRSKTSSTLVCGVET